MPHSSSSHGFLGALARDRRGVVGLYFAAVMGITVLLGIAALDLIRVHLVRSRIAMATDSALLAAGRSLGTDNWRDVGVAYYNANMTSALGATVTPVRAADFVENPAGATTRVSLTVSASVPMMSKGLGNISTMTAGVTSIAERRAQTVDLAMVLDNTGSMLTNNNIDKLATAAGTLVTALAKGQPTFPFSRVAVVPYAVAVNVGIPPGGVDYQDKDGNNIPITVDKLTADDQTNSMADKMVEGTTFAPTDPLGWHGCVLEDAGRAVAPAPDHDWQPYRWDPALDNFYDAKKASSVRSSLTYGNDGGGPNLGCPETPITPLTNNVARITAALNAMQAWHRGGTLSDVGMAWGARVLSPDPPIAGGVPWTDRRVLRAIVLMTDGDANFNVISSNSGLTYNKVNSAVKTDYSAYGRLDQFGLVGATDRTTAKQHIEANLSALCSTLKAAPFNMRIFTVTFGGSLAASTINVYRNCASTPEDYFPTADGPSLTKAFRDIGGALNELVLVQ